MTPEELEEQVIGTPQVIARRLIIDGKEALVRLQKPYVGADDLWISSIGPKGNMVETKAKTVDPYPQYGTVLIVEMWCEATKSVVTQGIMRNEFQTEAEFSRAIRGLMNKAQDDFLVEVIKAKRLHLMFNFTCGKTDTKVLGSEDDKASREDNSEGT